MPLPKKHCQFCTVFSNHAQSSEKVTATGKPSWAMGVCPWSPHLPGEKVRRKSTPALPVTASLSQVLSLFVVLRVLWGDNMERKIILICLWSQKLCSNHLSPKSNRKALESVKRQYKKTAHFKIQPKWHFKKYKGESSHQNAQS